MSLPIYQRVAVTDAGDVIPGAEYTVINENTGVAAPIYSDRTGLTLKSAPYFADSVGTIQFYIAQGTTFRVAASGGVGTYTDRYVYGVAEAVLVQADGDVEVLSGNLLVGTTSAYGAEGTTISSTGFLFSKRTSQVGLGIDRLATDGALIELKKDGTTVGSIGTLSGDLTIGTGDAGLRFNNPYGELLPHNVATNSGTDATVTLGSGGVRFKDLYLSGTAYVGGSAGNLLVGKTDTGIGTTGVVALASGRLFATASSDTSVFNRTSSDGAIIDIRKDGTTVGTMGSRNGAGITINSQGADGVLQNAGAESFAWNTGYFYPRTDNSKDLGFSALRWDDIYATNPNIITSDRNEKQDIQEIAEAETAVAKACKGLLRSFRWKSAVEKKGDDARIHFGIISQDLRDAFTEQGLDAGRYAMFVSSTWWETQTEVAAVEAVEGVEFVQAVEASEALYSEDGELVSEAVEAVEGVEGVEAVEAKDAYTRTDTFQALAEAPAGATERTRLGVRYSELLAFIIAAL